MCSRSQDRLLPKERSRHSLLARGRRPSSAHHRHSSDSRKTSRTAGGVLQGLVQARRKLPRQNVLDRIRTLSPMVHEALFSLVWPKFCLFKNLELVQKPGQSNEAVL